MPSVCLVSSAVSPVLRRKLERLSGCRVLALPPDPLLPPPLASHPDMICACMDRQIFFPASYAAAFPALVDQIVQASACTPVFSAAPRGPVYPADTGWNVTVLPSVLLCRPQSTAPCILQAARESGRTILPVRQGYAGCACLCIGPEILTADPGIFRILQKNRIPASFCSNAGIRLPGYDVGFPGGCGGCAGNFLFLFGTPDTLPCHTALRMTAERNGYTLCSLTPEPLTDVGGFRFL